MNIFCIQQVHFEGPSVIKDWAEARELNFHSILMYENPDLPNLESVDGLVIMGGPMSVNDDASLPWLKKEKSFIKEMIETNKPVLGICLGAQLIANVLGAEVRKNEFQEIGWLDIQLNEEAKLSPILNHLPQEFKTFQWHGDTFDIPENAKNLMSSEACQNQAFMYKNTLAMQFHMEMTKERIGVLAEHCYDTVEPAKFVHSKESLLDNAFHAQNHAWLFEILDRLFLVA